MREKLSIVKKNNKMGVKIEDFEDFVLFFFLGSFILAKFIGHFLYRAFGVGFICYYIIKILKRQYVVIGKGIIWQVGFVLSCIASLLYSKQIKLGHFYTILTTSIFIFTVSQYFYKEKLKTENMEKVLKYISFWGIVFMIYVFITQFNNFQYGRLGSRGLSEQFENAIGFSYYSIIISIVLIWNLFNEKKKKVFNCSMLCISLFVSIMTGGRKAVLLPICFLALYMIITSKNSFKLIKRVFFIAMLIVIIIILCMKVEFLYDIFGYRLEGLLYSIFKIGNPNAETITSDLGRASLAINGIKLFLNKPLIGYGLSMSLDLNYLSGLGYLHCHNNFVEMLVSGGIIMFIVYYWIYIYIFSNFFKLSKYDNTNLSKFFISFLIVNLISDVGTTSYNLLNFNIIILFATIYISILKKELKIKENI